MAQKSIKQLKIKTWEILELLYLSLLRSLGTVRSHQLNYACLRSAFENFVLNKTKKRQEGDNEKGCEKTPLILRTNCHAQITENNLVQKCDLLKMQNSCECDNLNHYIWNF